MNRDGDISDVIDFVACFARDALAEGPRELDYYLARYPDHPEEVAAEYARLIADYESPESDLGQGAGDAQACAGQRIGRFELARRLGVGGQGVVYLARDAALGREVAIKVLHGTFGLVTTSRRERFRREAEVISRLEHPGLAGVYEAELDGDQPYIVMRYVEGDPLSEYLRRHRRPSAMAGIHAILRAFEDLARALHVAHEAGVVHRDIKPGNVMVTPGGKFVLLDFGLARDLSQDVTLTRSGEFFGTPAYMAPEQLDPRARIDARCDIYSLGVTLFECLTGERPLRGVTLEDHARALLFDPVPDPTRINPLLTREMRVVLETALERKLERRFASALELADELRRLRQGEPIHARPPSLAYQLVSFVGRNRRLVVAASLVLIALVVGLVVASWGLLEAKRAEAGLQRRNYSYSMVLAADAIESGDGAQAQRYLAAAAGSEDRFEGAALAHLLDGGGEGHAGFDERVLRISAARGGRFVGVFGRLGTSKLLDLETGEWQPLDLPPELLHEPRNRRPRFRLFTDGAGLAVSSGECLGLYDIGAGAWKWRERCAWRPVLQASSRDDRWLCVVSDLDGSIRIIDARTGEVAAHLPAGDADSELTFAEDGTLLCGASRDGLWCWRWREPQADRQDLVRFDRPYDGTKSWAEGGERLLVMDDTSGTFRVLDRLGQMVSVGHLGAGVPRMTPDGSYVVACSEYGIEVFDAESGAHLRTLPGHEAPMEEVLAFDAQHVFAADRTGTIRSWDLAAGAVQTRFALGGPWTLALGRQVFVTAASGRFLLWDAERCRERMVRLSSISRRMMHVAISPDDTRVALFGGRSRFSASGGARYRLSMVDAASGEEAWSVDLDDRVAAVGFGRPGEFGMATVMGRLLIHDVQSGARLRELSLAGRTTALVWGPRGERFLRSSIAQGGQHVVSLWDSGGQEPLWTTAGQAVPTDALAFHAGGKIVASGDKEGTVGLWATRDGSALGTIDGLGEEILALAFHPDEPRLAVGVGSRVRVFDTALGERSPMEVLSYTVGTGTVQRVDFLREGAALYAATGTDLRVLELEADAARARDRERFRRARGMALRLLAAHGDLPAVRAVLEGSRMPERERADVLEVAAAHEDVDGLNKRAWDEFASRDGLARSDYERAVAWCQRAVEVAPERARYWNTLGILHLKLGENQLAVQCLTRSDEINRDPGNAEAGPLGASPFNLLPRAVARARLDDLERAEQDYERGGALAREARFAARTSELQAWIRAADLALTEARR